MRSIRDFSAARLPRIRSERDVSPRIVLVSRRQLVTSERGEKLNVCSTQFLADVSGEGNCAEDRGLYEETTSELDGEGAATEKTGNF